MHKSLLLIILLLFTLNVSAEVGSCDVLEIIDCDKDLASNESDKGSWVFGVGATSVNGIPDYIGSDETRNILLPVPYLFYNGPKVKISQSGITGKLFKSDKLYVSLSLSGAIPVDSDENNARKGMNDIDAVFEYGPSFKYYISGDDTNDNALFIDLNFREARTIKLDSLNFSASPSVIYRKKFEQDYFKGQLKFSSSLKFEFVSNKYADLFYGVEAQYATAQRIAYQANGGYAGYKFNSSLRWQRDNQIVSTFFSHRDISDAQYSTSPLVKVTTHFLFGVSYFWIFE